MTFWPLKYPRPAELMLSLLLGGACFVYYNLTLFLIGALIARAALLLLGVAAASEPTAAPPSGTVSVVNALLNTDTPSSNSAAAVNSLLDDQSETGTTPNSAAAVNSLLDDQPRTGAAPAAANTGSNAFVSTVIPQNPSFVSDMQNSQDTPPSSAALDTAQQEADSPNPSASVLDKLQGLVSTVRSDVSSLKATLATLMNTPTGQILTEGIPTTAPAPLATDTPEQMGNKSSGQAILGFGYFTIRSPWKATYNYNTDLLNVVMPQIGLAGPQPDGGSQQ
jgi:hypothetical protein